MAALKSYRPDIDGMRAIAVMSVAAYHYGFAATGGFIGVDVFFVISGFLIGSLIYREALQGSFSYRTFYVRRARRIVPALLAVLAATFLAMMVVATPDGLRDFGATAVATVLSASNLELWYSINYFRPVADLNPLLMTWSLGVEEQFYLLAPLVLMLLPRLRRSGRMIAMAGLIVVSLGLAVWGVRNEPQAAFFLLPGRVWELAAGVLLGMRDIERTRGNAPPRGAGIGTELRAVAGLVLIVVPVFAYDRFTPFPGLVAVPPVLGTVLLLDTHQSIINRRLLSAPVMRFVGLISYSLYLWHWPLISVTRLVLVHEPSLSLRLVLLAVSVALAWASYRWIEQPFRRSRAPASTTLWRFAAAMGLVAVATGSAYVLHGYPQRWPGGFVASADTTRLADPCLALHGAKPHLSDKCYPKGADRRLVALVGDSHAAALAPGIRAVAARGGMGVAQLTRSSCPFLVGVSRRVPKQPKQMADCAGFDRRVMKILQEDPRIGTVIIAGAWRAGDMREVFYAPTSGPDAPPGVLLQRGLSGAVRALQRHGKRVLIVRDVPFIEFLPVKQMAACVNPLRAALNGIVGGEGCGFVAGDEMEADAPALAVLERVARDTGAQLVDPHEALCGAHGCRIALHGRLLYRDQQHLTPAGARIASAVFATPLGLSSAEDGAVAGPLVGAAGAH
ncbi:acyltransferase family protein [Frateuria hangzhouensis]|uniref:acyltransferase family protein n=1 Tax=Frateuria hangzhouensis TaxID=2995589 RepID=UPI002260A7B5|nr:acyltransferase family protein [Frateuria sp. STR12]MCX7515131.1 acyltransferase family protein [Frateuria sp. STR12]